MYTLYGIPNCDTVKKAKKLLEDNSIDFEFFNFKKEKPSKKQIKEWASFLGDLPVNKRGPTFRKIKEAFEAGNKDQRIELILENLSSIKRPILEKNGKVLAVGFEPEVYSALK